MFIKLLVLAIFEMEILEHNVNENVSLINISIQVLIVDYIDRNLSFIFFLFLLMLEILFLLVFEWVQFLRILHFLFNLTINILFVLSSLHFQLVNLFLEFLEIADNKLLSAKYRKHHLS